MERLPRRLGVLVPSANVMLEADARRLTPEDVTVHVARMKMTRDDESQLAALFDLAPAASELLADAGVAAIAFGCTTGSLTGGLGYDRRIIERIEEQTGLPATTTATALIDGLRAEGATRVGLVSPYEAWLNQRVAEFLQANDLDVGGTIGLELPDPKDIAAIPIERIVEAIRSVDGDEVDAIVVSCTAFRGVEAAVRLGDSLGKPIVTSNQVTYWKLMQMVASSPDRPSRLTARPAGAAQ